MKLKLLLITLLAIIFVQSAMAAECTSTPVNGCTVTGNLDMTPGTYDFSGSGPATGIQVDAPVIINCHGAVLEGGGTGTSIFNVNSGGVLIQGCVIQNLGDSSIGIRVNTGTDNIFNSNSFINMTNPISTSLTGYTNMKIINNEFTGLPSFPINLYILSQNTTVAQNDFWDYSGFFCGDMSSEGCVDLNFSDNNALAANAVNIQNGYGLHMYGNSLPDTSFLLQPTGRGNNISNNQFVNDIYITLPYVTANTYLYNNTIAGILGDADDGDKIVYCVDGIGNRYLPGAEYGVSGPLGPDGSFGDNNIWGGSCPYLRSAYIMKNEYVSGGYLLPALNTTSDQLSMVDISTGLTNDNAFGFNGATSNLISSTDNMPIAGSTEWSVCWRYKSNSTNLQRVISQQGVFAPHLYTTPGIFNMLMSDYDWGWDKRYTVSGWSSNIWREDCLTKDATSGFSGFTFYSNGVETPLTIQLDDPSGIDTVFPSGSGALWYIGGNDQDQWFSGEISEVCMFDKKLSSPEVSRLATQSQCGFAPANDIVIEPPPCVGLQSNTVYSGNVKVCSGEYNVINVELAENTFMEFEPNVTVSGYGLGNEYEDVIRLAGNNITLDCHQYGVSHFNNDPQQGYNNGITGWYAGDGGGVGEGLNAIRLQGGGFSDNTIQNCFVFHSAFGIFTWYDSYNAKFINITFDDATYSIMHGIGDNGYAENIQFVNQNQNWFLLGKNATIINSNIPWLSVGRCGQPAEDGNWASFRIYNSTFSGNLCNLAPDGLMDIKDNYIDYFNPEIQHPEVLIDGVKGSISGNTIVTIEDGTDYDLSPVTWCDISTKKGNSYLDGYYPYVNGDSNLGTCNCDYINNDWTCTLTHDVVLTDNYTGVKVQTNNVNSVFNCNGNKITSAAKLPDQTDTIFMNINNDGIKIKNCEFEGFSKLATINADGTSFDNVKYDGVPTCYNPPDCTDEGAGQFYSVNNYWVNGRNVLINNSYISGETMLTVNAKDSAILTYGDFQYCADWSPEYYLADEANAVNNVVIVSNDNLNGIQNTSWQSFQIAGPDPTRLTMGITLNITNITYEDPSAYLRVILSSTPDTDGQLHETNINAEQMRLGENQIIWGNGPYMVELNSGTTYYVIFQAYAGPNANFRLSANVVNGGDYADGEFVFYDNVADAQNNKLGTIRNENYDSIMGIIFASAMPEYVPNSQNCVLWDYSSFGQTEGDCAPGFWNADLNRCEDPKRRGNGGNCYGTNGCAGGWSYMEPVYDWYACDMSDVAPLNFVMENTVVNRTNSRIADGVNSNGNANRFFDYTPFPDVYIGENVIIRNNEYYYPEDTSFTDPIDGYIGQQNAVAADCAGTKNCLIEGNKAYGSKASLILFEVMGDWLSPRRDCPGIGGVMRNNYAEPTERSGGAFGLFSTGGHEDSLFENNTQNHIKLLNNPKYNTGSKTSGAFVISSGAGNWEEENMTNGGNLTYRNNRLLNLDAEWSGYMSWWGQPFRKGIYVYNNYFNGTNNNVFTLNEAINRNFTVSYGIAISGNNYDVEFYNNTLENGNLKIIGNNPQANWCKGGIGNRMDMLYLQALNPIVEGVPFWSDMNNNWTFDPACSVINVPSGLLIYSNEGQGLDSDIHLNGNGVEIRGDNTTTTGVRVLPNWDNTNSSLTGEIKGLKIRGYQESLAFASYDTDGVIVGAKNITFRDSDVDKPYYDYGVGWNTVRTNKFQNLTVPAPLLSVNKPTSEITTSSTDLSYTVSTIAEIASCKILIGAAQLESGIITMPGVNVKSAASSHAFRGLSSGNVPWKVRCEDVFGNIVEQSDSFTVRLRGGGNLIPLGEKAEQLPTDVKQALSDNWNRITTTPGGSSALVITLIVIAIAMFLLRKK